MSCYLRFTMPIRMGFNYNRPHFAQLLRLTKGKRLGPPPAKSGAFAEVTVDTEVVFSSVSVIPTNELAAVRLRR